MHLHSRLTSCLTQSGVVVVATMAVLAAGSGIAGGNASPNIGEAGNASATTAHLRGAEVLGTPYAPSGPQDTASYIAPAPATAGTDKAEDGKCIARNTRTVPTRCVFGDSASQTTIFLVGDSHA